MLRIGPESPELKRKPVVGPGFETEQPIGDLMTLCKDDDIYTRHVTAMIIEDQQSDMDIVAELAYKDYQIEQLKMMLTQRLDLIRCGIGNNYSGNPKENEFYTSVICLLTEVV